MFLNTSMDTFRNWLWLSELRPIFEQEQPNVSWSEFESWVRKALETGRLDEGPMQSLGNFGRSRLGRFIRDAIMGTSLTGEILRDYTARAAQEEEGMLYKGAPTATETRPSRGKPGEELPELPELPGPEAEHGWAEFGKKKTPDSSDGQDPAYIDKPLGPPDDEEGMEYRAAKPSVLRKPSNILIPPSLRAAARYGSPPVGRR